MWVFNSRQNSLQKQCFQTVPFTRENHPKHTKLNRNVEFYTKARSDSFPNDFHLKAKIIVICTISPLNEKKNLFISEFLSIKSQMTEELNMFLYYACYSVHRGKKVCNHVKQKGTKERIIVTFWSFWIFEICVLQFLALK